MTEALKVDLTTFITGEKRRKRAVQKLARFVLSCPANDKAFFQRLYNGEIECDQFTADFYRDQFTKWKKKEKSRKAKKSHSLRGRVKRKDDKRRDPRLPTYSRGIIAAVIPEVIDSA